LVDKKIKSSQLIFNNLKNSAKLESTIKDLESFLNGLQKEIQKTISAKKKNDKLQKEVTRELKIIDENISNLKTYYVENLEIISTDLTNLLLEKLTLLQNTKEDISFVNEEAALIELLKVNKEISSFKLENDLLTSDEVASIKKEVEDKKKADAKKIADKKKADKKKAADAKERKRLKNFKTLTMSCMYSINGRYLTYSWAYDGKKLYWEGIPINFGKSNIEQGMTTSLRKLPGKDRFNIKITGIGVMEFNNDFDSKNSEMDYMGMKAFGSCY
jgi:hypothetical protein